MVLANFLSSMPARLELRSRLSLVYGWAANGASLIMLNLKAILLGIAAGATALFMAFIKGGQAARDKLAAKSQRFARKKEGKAHEAMIDGLKKESEVRNEEVDITNHDHFTKR